MKNFKKICQLLMLIALFSVFGIIENVKAVVVDQNVRRDMSTRVENVSV